MHGFKCESHEVRSAQPLLYNIYKLNKWQYKPDNREPYEVCSGVSHDFLNLEPLRTLQCSVPKSERWP